MKIAVASNHIGFKAKRAILGILRELNHEPIDFGPFNHAHCDYTDYAALAAAAVSKGEADRGILTGGTAIGMTITANKFPGVRAALCHDELTVQLSRRQINANVLCLPANIFCERFIAQAVKIWLGTQFEGGHHARRVDKIKKLERELRKKVTGQMPVDSVS